MSTTPLVARPRSRPPLTGAPPAAERTVAARRVATVRGSSSWAAENADLLRRVQRLSPLLADLGRDLAAARRESIALRRENQALRMRVATLERRAVAAAPTIGASRPASPWTGARLQLPTVPRSRQPRR